MMTAQLLKQEQDDNDQTEKESDPGSVRPVLLGLRNLVRDVCCNKKEDVGLPPHKDKITTDDRIAVVGLPPHEDKSIICGDYDYNELFDGYLKSDKTKMLVKAIRHIPKAKEEDARCREKGQFRFWTLSNMDNDRMSNQEDYASLRKYKVAVAELAGKEAVKKHLLEMVAEAEKDCDQLRAVVEDLKMKLPCDSNENINETVLYYIAAKRDNKNEPPLHEYWNGCSVNSSATATLPIMAYTASSKQKLSHVPAAVHSELENADKRKLDCHSARLRAEHLSALQLVHNNDVVTKFWLNTSECSTDWKLVSYDKMDKRTRSKYLQCRLVTLDSHTHSLGKVMLGACAFASTLTMTWVHFTQLLADMIAEGMNGIEKMMLGVYVFMILIQVIWFRFNWKDACNDVDKNPDFVLSNENKTAFENSSETVTNLAEWEQASKSGLQSTRFYATVIKAFDIPYDIAYAPTRFHYKKTSQPWAQLKTNQTRVWVFGYPIVEMSNVENHGNRTVSQTCRFLLSFANVIVLVCSHFRQDDMSLSQSVLSLLISALISVASLVFSWKNLINDTAEFEGAQFALDGMLNSEAESGQAYKSAAIQMINSHMK